MNIKNSTALKFAAIALLPVLAMLWPAAVNSFVLTFGEQALLRTRPVDPRDLLRGDYVVLDYDISDLSNYPEITQRGGRGDIVYVTLEKDGDGVAEASGASFTPPSGGLWIKGVFSDGWSERVDYGIGVYYVPEGTGWELEKAIRYSDVLADVRIWRGKAVIKELMTASH
ncbi:hypothetical protein FACS1894204_05850 [Synergistales bacterium]|nr:hypothetical protein FACS1894204_05850 [Synergistales bacterium]